MVEDVRFGHAGGAEVERGRDDQGREDEEHCFPGPPARRRGGHRRGGWGRLEFARH